MQSTVSCSAGHPDCLANSLAWLAVVNARLISYHAECGQAFTSALFARERQRAECMAVSRLARHIAVTALHMLDSSHALIIFTPCQTINCRTIRTVRTGSARQANGQLPASRSDHRIMPGCKGPLFPGSHMRNHGREAAVRWSPHRMRKPPKTRPCRLRCCGWQMKVLLAAVSRMSTQSPAASAGRSAMARASASMLCAHLCRGCSLAPGQASAQIAWRSACRSARSAWRGMPHAHSAASNRSQSWGCLQ